MRIRFRQSGGFTGLVRGCCIDTDALPARERDRIERLARSARSLEAETPAKHAHTADLCQYEITIELGESPSKLAFDDLSVPEPIAPLLDYLLSRADPIGDPRD